MFVETKIYRLELWVELKQLADGQQLVKWTECLHQPICAAVGHTGRA